MQKNGKKRKNESLAGHQISDACDKRTNNCNYRINKDKFDFPFKDGFLSSIFNARFVEHFICKTDEHLTRIVNTVVILFSPLCGRAALRLVHSTTVYSLMMLYMKNAFRFVSVVQISFTKNQTVSRYCNQGHPTSIFVKYLFGIRFEIQNFRNFCCKISCLPAPPRIFEHLKNGIIAHFYNFYPKKVTQNFRESFFLAEIFEKVSFDPHNFRITGISARKSEQM